MWFLNAWFTIFQLNETKMSKETQKDDEYMSCDIEYEECAPILPPVFENPPSHNAEYWNPVKMPFWKWRV